MVLIVPLSEPSLSGALGEYYINREMDHIAATVRQMLLAKKSSHLRHQEVTGYEVCDGRRNPREVLSDVCGLLFSGHHPFGFKGNTHNYYSSANSFMNQVIDDFVCNYELSNMNQVVNALVYYLIN